MNVVKSLISDSTQAHKGSEWSGATYSPHYLLNNVTVCVVCACVCIVHVCIYADVGVCMYNIIGRYYVCTMYLLNWYVHVCYTLDHLMVIFHIAWHTMCMARGEGLEILLKQMFNSQLSFRSIWIRVHRCQKTAIIHTAYRVMSIVPHRRGGGQSNVSYHRDVLRPTGRFSWSLSGKRCFLIWRQLHFCNFYLGWVADNRLTSVTDYKQRCPHPDRAHAGLCSVHERSPKIGIGCLFS